MADQSVVRELLIAVGVDVDSSGFDQVQAGVSQMMGGLATLATVAAGAAAALAAVTAAAVANADAVARDAVEIDRLAKSVGTTAQELGGLALAVSEFGGDLPDAADLLGTLTDRAEDAKGGMQSFIDDFKLIGLEVQDLKGKDPVGLLSAFADAIAETDDPNKRLAASVRILGDDLGRKMLPLLMQGSDALEEYKKIAIETGTVLSEEGVQAARDYEAATRSLGRQFTGIRNQLGAALLPALTDLAERFTLLAESTRKWITTGVDKYGDTVTKMAKDLADAVSRNSEIVAVGIGLITGSLIALAAAGVVVTVVLAVVAVIGGLASALSGVASILLAIGAGTVGGGMLAGLGVALLIVGGAILTITAYVAPFVALLVAMGLALDDLRSYLNGDVSALGAFLEANREAEGPLGEMARLLDTVGVAFEAFGEWATAFAGVLTEYFGPSITSANSLLGTFSDGITTFLSGAGAMLVDFFSNVLEGSLLTTRLTLETIIAAMREATELWNNLDVASSRLDFGSGATAAASIPSSFVNNVVNNISGGDSAATASEVTSSIRNAMLAFTGGQR